MSHFRFLAPALLATAMAAMAAMTAMAAMAAMAVQSTPPATGVAQQELKPVEPAKEEAKEIVTPSGLKYFDLKVGEGAEAKSGSIVEVLFTGWLESDGRKFDESLDPKQPYRFQLGKGQVIKAWDEGIAGMRVGGKRRLVVPPELGYGRQGAGAIVPPGASLRFEVELLKIAQPG
ncbi:MAG TPA: FKBP-type peptidyl-prolyl cis-trans isomerase [Thermoanaerobaculia bacterium]|nr:FKBP-type peptidyl-prolyl cis-trans isomerase [Thermoanaerobaculia bacterium]